MADLTDRGLSILVFALYHQLTSGEVVTGVALDDGAGHAADPEGVREVTEAGLATVDGNRVVLTGPGASRLQALAEAVRSA